MSTLSSVRGGVAGLRAAMYDIRKKSQKDCVFIVHFWAAWCEPCAHMDTVLESLATASSSAGLHLVGLRCEAEEEGEVSEAYNVEAVPTFVALTLKGTTNDELVEEIGRVEGASPHELGQLVDRIATREEYRRPAAKLDVASGQQDLHSRLEALVKKERVMLFMKGKPSEPRCGFSRKVADALVSCYGADTAAAQSSVDELFGNFDILGDQEVRQGLKEFSKWPTFPQLYVDGELIGGCDIVLEMHEAGELKELIIASS